MMKHILWLCSWYPNEVDKFRGDFVQRQAIATSQFCKIDVVHVVFCDEDHATATTVNENLVEHIFYVKKKNKLVDFLFFYFIHQKIRRQFINKIDLVHVQVTMNAGIMALIWKKIYNIPYVITEHYGIYNDKIEDRFSNRSNIYQFVCKQVFKYAELLISVSNFIAEGIKKEVCDIKVEIANNVVDTNLFYHQTKDDNSIFQFVHVSNLSTNKNVIGILQAFEKLLNKQNKIELIIIGGEQSDIDKLIKDFIHIKDKIKFVGEIEYAEVATWIQKGNCTIINSKIENSPCVLIESLCCGVPVIATHVGGIPEIISKENGILIESNNVQQLADAMNEIIENKSNYNSIEIATKAIQKYSYESVGNKINELYNSLIH